MTYYLYGAIYLLMLLLLALLIGLAHLGIGGIGLRLIPAIAIASLIAVYFMDLRNASNLVRLFAVGAILWVVFMFVLTFSDYLTR